MYFLNEEHERNYTELLVRFPVAIDDAEYAVASYLASLPNVFWRFDMSELLNSPFDWLFKDLQVYEETEELPSCLMWLKDNSAEYYLALLGLQFWSGNKNDFQLNRALYNWNGDYIKIFEQSYKIFRKL
jgi:hypothetical protein